MKNRALAILMLVLVLLVSSLAGSSLVRPANAGTEDVIYKIADPTGDWGYPSPYGRYPRGPGYVRMSFIFDTLVWKNSHGFVPALAESWEYLENELAYVFYLRKNVSWHDGNNFTAEDVVFTFEYIKSHPTAWVDPSIVNRTETIDKYTVKLYLKELYAPFLSDVAGTLPILPKHIWSDVEDPNTYTKPEAAVGTGPFKLADYDKTHGTYLYEAYEGYYLGKPEVDKIAFVKISNEMAPTALQNGEINAASIPPETVDALTKKGFTIIQESGSWNAKLMINHNKDPLSSKEFRQALAYAINRSELVEIAQRGYATPGSPGMIPPANDWYNPNIEKYEYNPQKARNILESLGYELGNQYYEKDGKTLELEILVKTGRESDAELVKPQLEAVGIKIDLRSLESKTIDSMVLNWQFDLALSGHGGLGGDPDILRRVTIGGGFNSARYSKNETLNQLFESQLREMDREERKAILDKIQEIYAEELPALTLYYPKGYWAHDGTLDLYYTPGGVASGVPIPLNKLAFMEYTPKASGPSPESIALIAGGVAVAIVAVAALYLHLRRRR